MWLRRKVTAVENELEDQVQVEITSDLDHKLTFPDLHKQTTSS